jgi:hypothetical protein
MLKSISFQHRFGMGAIKGCLDLEAQYSLKATFFVRFFLNWRTKAMPNNTASMLE